MNRILIVGGGMTGLTAAYQLQKWAAKTGVVPEIHLVEKAERLGGKTSTELVDGLVVERGPDSFVGHKPWLKELAKELGLALTGPNPAVKKTYIWSGKRLEPLPIGLQIMIPTQFGPFIRTPLLSPLGKLRAAMEPFIPARKEEGDESIGSFVRRRFGQEMLDQIAGPLMAGIYGGNWDEISMQASFPQFMKIEREKGSLLLNALRNKKQAQPQSTTGSPFLTVPTGLQTIVDRLAAVLAGRVQFHLGTTVTALEPVRGALGGAPAGAGAVTEAAALAHGASGYRVRLSSGEEMTADAVILATPAYVAADLVDGFLPAVSTELREVPYGNSVVVALGYRQADLDHPLDGTGFIVPARYPMEVTASTWVSSKWAHAAPSDKALLRVFLGRAGGKDWTAESDEAILAEIRKGLRETMGLTAEPFLTRIFRYRKANPQYRVGHLDRMAKLRRQLPRGLYLAGAAYGGVGLPDCVREGQAVAEKVANQLGWIREG
jgi:oxygen-dependent protoporphyrinogen oxidase